MINGNTDDFLDTGWYTEATLYLNGNIYWCEAQTDFGTGITTFFVDKWAVQNENNTYYHTILEPDGTMNWSRVLEIEDPDLDIIKRRFLEAAIFDGKTFWQVERNSAWLDEEMVPCTNVVKR